MSTTKKFGAAAALALAAAAFAQPASFTDLGNHTTSGSFTQEVTLTSATDIQWFKVVLPAALPIQGYVDIWTNSSGASPMTDTEAGLYDNTGARIANDDDGDDGLFTLLSFGQTTPARAAHGNGNARTGQNGQLAGGTYWLAVGRFNVNFLATDWSVNSTYTGTQTTTRLNFEIQAPGALAGSLALTPNRGVPGDIFTAAVTVLPGTTPVSTGITVRLDASGVNAGSSIALLDDGISPDDFAGDNIFTANVTVGAGTAQGSHTLVATIRDAQNRSSTSNANYSIPQQNDDCAGAAPAIVGTNSFDNTDATTDGAACVGSAKDVWFSFNPPADGDYVIETCNGVGFDTVLAAFDSCGGNSLACNDDFCGLQSHIQVDGLVANSPIIIRIATYGTAGTNGGPGTFTISSLGPTNPTGVGAATPNPAYPGDVVQLHVTVTPGLRPASTGLAVRGDLTALGGSATQTFYDDGSNGDDFAGDNIFSVNATIPANFAQASYNIPFNITDAQSRSGSGNFTGQVSIPPQWDETINGGGDAGDLPATAQVPEGTGSLSLIAGVLGAGDADMYKIQICDVANFTATTDAPETNGDTQLWLFSADGHGVQFNDDQVGLHSGFGNQFVTATGTYYIAVSQYDNDAIDDAGAALWIDTPFASVRAPDGPGAANIIAGWTGGGAGLNYRITMTGACFAGCLADFNGDTIVDFNDYLDFIQAFSTNDPTGDFNHDGVIDFNDYLDFVQALAEGC